ncbi:MAG: hypothetical protein ACK57I_10920 [Akkermansiaceae bacterium]|jgi:hypothetical protein
MKCIRMILSGLVAIPAVLLLFSVGIGFLNVVLGAPVYGSQRSIGSLLLCGFFSIIAFMLWPRENKDSSNSRSAYNSLPDRQSKADFIANVAASRLGISDDKFKLHLSDDLKYPPGEIMDMWDELAEDYGIDLSSKDFPEISSIDKLRHKLNS